MLPISSIVYTATETIENGELKFTAPPVGRSRKVAIRESRALPLFQGTGGASIDPESYATAATDLSLDGAYQPD